MESFQRARDNIPMSLSQKFIVPEEHRPNLSQISTQASIPIIDLSFDLNDHDPPSPLLVQEILQASEEYGFFQIINHGVPQDLCKKTMTAVADFYSLPSQERSQFTDSTKPVKFTEYLLKSKDQENANVSLWSESLNHPWDPAGDFASLLPQNPPQYRETFAEYAKEIDKVMKRLFGLISQGLGLEKDYLEKKLGENPWLTALANFFPPCPDPELTLGMSTHTDLSALTVLMQSEEVTCLQVLKDDKWIAVHPLPNAFVINLGDQLEVLSNGRLKSVHHRVVTNKMQQRISVALFYGPNMETMIGPIEELTDEQNPPLYRSYTCAEFLEEFKRQAGKRPMVKEAFQLRRQ
ncbi:protein DMR6-LIKE OXYGENASE 1-like [Humulus lupulus]|uniref:protein DMR6-LIKE OXYGENASE 1-like n=1 Tax=Humulus lupulus TaxID=3486 RepID=UPI002B40DBE2|nr:protein DMR6-LIKE OXYGENASE 1-like [Humulus lupulus]